MQCNQGKAIRAPLQSLAGGNTMVFNQAARDLMLDAGGHLDIVSHDWWAYLLVTGAGGMFGGVLRASGIGTA